ncbi:TniB family NTP-binding protein [Chelativorans intermedius]|uniref:TniB family NTP-binding protein n=1 Tax=Chelativorans intermedius TaxID=515947 RepID=UPI0021BE44D7|nr:TniB family NTP-binding protein [Chelativorans intermedius]MCT9000457.1 TniB family NTP-binding protein [Chelativorans intermedius]
MTTDLNHLAPDLQTVAAGDDAQRIAFIRGQWWIGYPQAQAALDLLRTAMEKSPDAFDRSAFSCWGRPTTENR